MATWVGGEHGADRTYNTPHYVQVLYTYYTMYNVYTPTDNNNIAIANMSPFITHSKPFKLHPYMIYLYSSHGG